MRSLVAVIFAVVLAGGASVANAADMKKPESIAEHMAIKLVRGVTNVVTAVVELPKQTYKTTKANGPIGLVTGPPKGIIMTLYRGFIGATETVFFLVPQPGYYDEMIDPEFVWQDWEPADIRRETKGE